MRQRHRPYVYRRLSTPQIHPLHLGASSDERLRSDTANLYRSALEKTDTNATYHAVAEEGVRVRDLAEAIGRGPNVPVVSLAPEQVGEHFGWLGAFAGWDIPASSKQTRQKLGWIPTGPGLISDLENARYS